MKYSFDKTSRSRYVLPDKETALFVLSASNSDNNSECWYSINDEKFPWMELFPRCYIAFALGSSNQMLLFTYEQLTKTLDGCLRIEDNPEIKKKVHYHFSFAVEGSKVFLSGNY